MERDSSNDLVTCGKCGAAIAESRDTRPEERQPCPRCGSTSRLFRVAIVGQAVVSATLSVKVDVIPAPAEAEPTTETFREVGYNVTWYAYPDGQYLVQVFDDSGNLLDGGGGDDPEEMILEVAERLLPPKGD
jgi:hypothetical protein